MNDNHAISETYLRLADVGGEQQEDTRKPSLGTAALISSLAASKIVLAALVATTFTSGQGAIMNDAMAEDGDEDSEDENSKSKSRDTISILD